MAFEMVGRRLQYVMATSGAKGMPLEGAKTYKIQAATENSRPKTSGPSSLIDNQIRSMLQDRPAFSEHSAGKD